MEERDMNALEALGQSAAGEIRCITIIGQIEGHVALPADTKTTRYEHIMPLLAAAEESEETKGLLILLNTVGGDIEAGLGLAELIAGMRTPTASLVLGAATPSEFPLPWPPQGPLSCPPPP